jgi:hypothetical protein
MPIINSPGGGDRKLVARLLMSDNSTEVIAQLKALNIKYIIIDSQTAIEKFYSVVQLAELDLKTYYDTQSGEVFRTSDYYKTFLSQLYWFDAKNIQGIKRAFVSGSVKFEGEDIPEVKVFEMR